MEQVGLFTSGCMLYDVPCLSATDDHFSYASTLSIYVYRRNRGGLSTQNNNNTNEMDDDDFLENDLSHATGQQRNESSSVSMLSSQSDGISLAHILVGPESTIFSYAANSFLHVAITIGRSHGVFVWSAATGEPLSWPAVYTQPRPRATHSTVPFATSVFLHDEDVFATCVSVWGRSKPDDGEPNASNNNTNVNPANPLILFGGTAGCVSLLHTGSFQCATTQCKDDDCFITCCACAPYNVSHTVNDTAQNFQSLAAVGTSQGALAVFRAQSASNGSRVDLELLFEISDLFDDIRAKKGEGF